MILRAKLSFWWQQRMPREKAVLAAGAALLLLVIFWLLIEPAIQLRERMQTELPVLREDLVWMQAQVSEIEQLRGSGDTSRSGKAELTIALVEELLHTAGLHGQISELRPASGQSVSLKFDQVDYGQLMEFLLELRKRAAARISLASISHKQDQAGMVEASLSLSPDSPQ